MVKMMQSILIIIQFVLIGTDLVYGYFEEQPKLITENGNLVFESALDRNITFRFKGSGCLNINDFNLLKMVDGSQDNATSSGNANTRLAQLESRLDDLRTQITGSRSVLYRLTRLENRTRPAQIGGAQLQIRLRGALRRINRLESRVDTITSKLQEDNCKSNPCEHGGTCIDIYDGFMCKCMDTWTGVTCQEDVNECIVFAGSDLGCQNGATCLNAPGGYSCICQNGWQGLHCTRRTVDCLSAPLGELCGHGTCVHTNDPIGYTCICEQGWKTNGVTPACTIDVDECNSAKPHCSVDPMVQCINLPGSYTCGFCPLGYTGNGHYCMDIDECATNNGGCSTLPSVSCINSRGSYHCGACPLGWQGDGKTCIRSSPSGSCMPTICHPLARCIEMSYGPMCVCPAGYTGLGFGPNGCTMRSNDPCTRNPCLNGGTCQSNGTTFTCICPAGTLAPICRTNHDNCAINPCLNGGTCIATSVSFICRCPAAFTGTTCQTETSTCGDLLTSPQGTLKYPLSDQYSHNIKCAWLIRTNITQVLNITFTKFELEFSRECRFDWLQIHDGRSSASHIIGRFCGNDLPKGGNIISTHNYLYLWFRSDNTSSHDGFELTWESINPVCGGEMTITTHGTISSPGSPGNYPQNRDCEWHLNAPPGKRIELHFFTMQLEAHDECQYDYLSIYSGSSTSAPLLEQFCNTSHPEPLLSPFNELMLHFHSDGDGTDAGFQIHYSVVEGIPGCGGTYTMNRGEIASPLINGVYPKNLFCEYEIKLPKGARINMQFLEFELEMNRNCDFDYLEIYEGSSTDDPKVGKFCGHMLPRQYKSLGNVLLIIFRSDWSSSHKGFRLSYELICGGSFENETGILMSPLYPQRYEESRQCRYDITAPVAKAIVLDFIDLDIEDSSYPDCDFDSISIYDGHTPNDTLLGKYCGTVKPPQMVSTLNTMTLLFESDSSVSGRGFKANYSLIDTKCGGVVKKLGIMIKPPMDSFGYQHDSTCKWVIDAPPDQIVQLSFSVFDLEGYSDCAFDSLTIYEGTEQNNQVIGKYCGNALPPVILSNGPMITIVFMSDASNSGEGFLANYNFIESKNLCGGKYFTRSGFIRSPGYPNGTYPPNKDCLWLISAPSGKQVELQVNSFDLEESSNCQFDYLEIRNGGNSQSPLVGQFCGTEIIKTIRSFSNQLYIRFKTDSSMPGKGFELEWDATSTGCGGVLNNSPRGSITSPNYPEPYGANAQCDWRISVSPGSTIQLIFTDLDMEEHGICAFDSVEVFDGRDSAAKSFGKICASNSHPIQFNSTSNHVFVRMQSDISHEGRGFDLKYNMLCKREIRLHRGVIESPNYPELYPPNINCEWTVIAPLGNNIAVSFASFYVEFAFDFESQYPCNMDYLQIEERNDKEILRSTKYCKDMPAPFTSISEIVVFKFITDSSVSDKGFHLEFEVQGCGDHFIRHSGNFSSPNYPQPYPHNVHCQWTITSDAGTLIELTFNDFDFESSSSCYTDGLVISSSESDVRPITKFCGSMHKTPGTITSHTNRLFIQFYSDESFSGRGFSASYTTVSTRCGGVYKIAKGVIMSQNYPMNYEANSHCEWLLETEDTHTLSLRFFDFDVEESPECVHDFIQVYDGYEKNPQRLLIQHCGSQVPNNTLVSTGNKMLVVMESDSNYQSKGFNASFTTNCGSNIVTNSSGIITIGGNVKWLSSSCNWTIKAAEPGYHVILTVMKLQNKLIENMYVVEPASSFATNGSCVRQITIHDGDSTSAPIRETLCGYSHPPPIVSHGNALTISIVSLFQEYSLATAIDFSFEAHYTVLDLCGGTFKSIGGMVASPNYPKSYPDNVECVWIIEASPGNRMLFTIEMLDIDQSDLCNEDYLEIRENDQRGKLLGIFCGNTIPPSFPPNQRIWMKFRSDNNGVGMGFRAEYNYARHVDLNGKTGIITSPLYPDTPDLIEDQTYRISVELRKVISIAFDSLYYQIEDTLTIYDGYDTTAEKLDNIKEFITQPFISSTNVLYIVCTLNSVVNVKFKLTWTEIAQNSESSAQNGTNTINCTENSIVNVNTSDVYHINSPGYPYGYEENLKCIWTFISSVIGYHPAVVLLNVDLEDQSQCIADYVRLSTSKDLKVFNEVGKVCQSSSLNQSMYEGVPYLKMEFNSDYFANKTGFSSIVGLRCGGLMTGPRGFISDNMTKNSVDAVFYNGTCQWTITVRSGRTIKFNFEKLDIKPKSDGSCDGYVLIRNGQEYDSPFLGNGQYCGLDKSTVVIPETSGSKAVITYVRGRLYFHDKYTLLYKEVSFDCGGQIILDKSMNSTTITSPNYPNIPNAHIECIWTVTVPNGELIKVDFIERFDLTKSPNCDQEYVELRDGGTMSSHFVEAFCNEMPGTTWSVSNILKIKYFTDVIVPKNGFKAIISIAKCGGFYRDAPIGGIKSEGFPGLGAYPSNSICEYRIQGKIGTALNFTFLDLDLPTSEDNCNDTDHLIFYNSFPVDEDKVANLDQIGIFCGSEIPRNLIADGQEVLIKFVTKAPNSKYRGWRILYTSTVEQCGGEIIAESGIITSPGYPSNRKFRRFCEWKITVPKGRRIKLEILDLDIMPSTQNVDLILKAGRPFQQRIGLYNDHSYSSRIKFLTGTDSSGPVYSSDNKMLITMWMFSNIGHRGFKFSFSSDEPTICEGNLDGPDGQFLSPFNISSFYCEYSRSGQLISNKEGVGTIAIRLSDIISAKNDSDVCLPGIPSGVMVKFEPLTTAKYFYRHCTGSVKKYDLVLSPFHTTRVIIKQGFFLVFSNQYNIQYKIHECGGLITSNMTYTVSQPNFTAGYGEVNCAWQFRGVKGLKIRVNIVHSKFNCENEYINVYNGPYATSPKIDRICGDATNQSLITLNSYQMFFEYHSANYDPNSKFDVNIQSSYSVCGGIIVAPIYTFRNPQNGTQYPNNVECIWEIHVHQGFHIGLEFVDRFHLEDSPNCTKDYIEIYDLVGTEWFSLGRICGRNSPKAFNSTGLQMRLKFRTNDAITGDGFIVNWQANCGGTFDVTENIQTIISPKYPESYPKNAFCNYTLLAAKMDIINVNFEDFELEGTASTCRYDNVTISIFEDYSYLAQPQMKTIGTYCSKNSLPILQYRHKIMIILRSDSWIERRGFKFTYSLNRCGGQVNTSKTVGVFLTNDNTNYYTGMTCVWNITAPEDKYIDIRFEKLDLTTSDDCYSDVVEVFQGLEPIETERKAKLCGNLTSHTPTIRLKTNKGILKFTNQFFSVQQEFSALILFKTKCHHEIQLTASNPTYNITEVSAAYVNNLDCHYIVTVPQGHIVSMKFLSFHIAPCTSSNQSCTCDYVNVKDGPGIFAESITGQLCGHSVPRDVASSNSALWVHFVTDSMDSSTGFSATLQMAESTCGVRHFELNSTVNEAIIRSPGGSRYPPNVRCQWIVEALYDEVIHVHFKQLDVQNSTLCESDNVQLIDENVEKIITEGDGSEVVYSGKKYFALNPHFFSGKHIASAVHKYCGSDIPSDFYSSSNKLKITFRSDSQFEQSGFKIVVKMLDACARNFTGSQGRIYSKKSENCQTYIIAPANQTISLYFTKFNYYTATSACSNETKPLEVYDASPGGGLIQSFCPDQTPNPIFSNSSVLLLKFRKIETTWVESYGLYDITFLATDKGRGCGGQLFNYAGSFTSPLYPLNDRSYSDCVWNIVVPPNLRVALQFEIFDLGSKKTCTNNYLQVIEIDENGNEQVARQFCGEESPSTYMGERNILSIRFKKTTNFAGTGWKINFMSVEKDSNLGSW